MEEEAYCPESESTLGYEVYEYNIECRAVLSHPAELVKRGGGALSRGLGDCASSFTLPHDNGPSMPTVRDACWDSSESLASPC